MTLKEVKTIREGDEIFWNDPDNGLCSRTYKVQSIEINGNIITITDPDGAVLECFANELS